MSNNDIDTITSKLSDGEKKNLLNQINDSLNSNPLMVDEQYVNFIERENNDNKSKSLKKEVEELGFFMKLILKIRSFILGKDIHEVYNRDLLTNLERRISYTAPTLVDIKKRRYTSILINDFLKVQSLISPFIQIFEEVWDSPVALEKLITAIISDKHHSVKTELYDFVRESEIDNLIASGDGLESIKKMLLRSIYDYKKKMPDFVFSECEDELTGLISLKNIVLYNYVPLYKLMGISSEDNYNSVKDKTVSMNLVVKYLEEFYKLLIHFTGTTLTQNSIEYFSTVYSDEIDSGSLWESFVQLSDKLKKMTVAYPFDDLVKFSKGNPFYKIDFSVKEISISEFYFTVLKKEMIAQLNSVFVKRDRAVTSQILDKLFSNFDYLNLQNYNYLKEFDIAKTNLPYFKYIETVGILINFLKYYYLREYKDILFVLNKHVYEKNHILQTRALEISIGIETLIERIIKFDRSMAADSEVGKTMRTLLVNVINNKQNIRMYKAFIKQKDEEVLELLKLGVKLLLDLEKILSQTVKNPSDSVKLQVSAIHPSISRKKTFKEVLTDKSREIKDFSEILNKKIIFDSDQ